MKKTISLLCLGLVLNMAFGACNSKAPKSTSSVDALEMEKKLIGSWRFLYTDAADEAAPPKDMTYTFKADRTSNLEFTDEKNEKRKIEGTYKIEEDRLQLFKGGELTREFLFQFQGDDTVRFTETQSKHSFCLGRLIE